MKLDYRKIAQELLDPLAMAFLVILASTLLACGDSRATKRDRADQRTFASPDDAGDALQAASGNHDDAALDSILGAHSKAILRSGDPVEDRASLDSFAKKYGKMNRWVQMTDGTRMLYVGADNYPFPLPLAHDSNSKWYFHTKAGRDLLLARRIGQNELLAIDACDALANAEELYFKAGHDGNPAHQYTQKIISTPGKQDGLYWKVTPDRPASPLGRVDEFAKDAVSAASSGGPTVFDGYVFRILTAQGKNAKGGAEDYQVGESLKKGYAVIANPIKYGNSGIMTFLLSREGTVYQRDLGKNNTAVATAIRSYDPEPGWRPAE